MTIRWLISLTAFGMGLLVAQTPTEPRLALAQDKVPLIYPLSGRMRWTGTRLAGCDYCEGKNPIIWAVDRQGMRSAVSFDISDAGYIGVRDVAAGADGSISAVGLAISGDSRMGMFVAWISPDKSRQIITQVSPYNPEVVTVASDGTIWTVGAVLSDHHLVKYPNVLRHYTPTGQLLSSTLVGRVRPNSGGLFNVSATSALMASSDRIGWLTATCQYIEFSFDAVELGRYACPSGYSNILDITGVALSSTDDLLIGGRSPAAFPPLELDRATNSWNIVPVHNDSGKTQMILGFDGRTLITSAMSDRGPHWMRRYMWSNGPSTGGQ
jgi:hypothetical protein